MGGPISTLKYVWGSITGNLWNMVRAGSNNTTWGIAGAIICGVLGFSGGGPFGSIAGMVVGGIGGSALAYALS